MDQVEQGIHHEIWLFHFHHNHFRLVPTYFAVIESNQSKYEYDVNTCMIETIVSLVKINFMNAERIY